MSLENEAASDEAVQSEDALAAEGELGTSEQAIILPIVEPGPVGQCVAACQKYSTANITGLCCSCNGAVKVFSRHPAIPNMYLCR